MEACALSGELVLRYAFRPSPSFDPVAATRLGRELRSPALVNEVTLLDKGDEAPRPLPARAALFRTELPDNVDAAVFPARREPGIVLRLREVAGRPAVASAWHPAPVGAADAFRCLATEEPSASLPVDVDGRVDVELAPYQAITVLLRFDHPHGSSAPDPSTSPKEDS
jgi:alpha-mannosidase